MRRNNPHVVPIYDVGEIDGRLYVTMRLINGVDLQSLLDTGPLEPARAVHIIEQIASALHSAHQAGLVNAEVHPPRRGRCSSCNHAPTAALTGEYTATTSNSCGGKSTVTLTRTGDVDLDSLPDPVTLPPRVVSPAEALHGRYHHTRAFTNGQKHVRRTATHGRFHKRGTRRDWRAESGLAAGG